MIVRKLKSEKFNNFKSQLIEKAQQNPLETSFYVTIKINSKEYGLKLQPEKKHSIVVLQAFEIDRTECGLIHTPITKNHFILSLLEILIVQGVA